MKSGYVSIVGKPNVGKSTLLNSVLDMHLAITSNVRGTTRNVIYGVYEDSDSQIVFVDTPGISKPGTKLSTILNKKAYTMTDNVDLILFVVDVNDFTKADEIILDRFDGSIPVILVLNKVDKINKDLLLEKIAYFSTLYDFKEIYPISALKDKTKDFVSVIKKYLTNTEKIYESDTVTNISTSFYVSEIIREKVLRKTREEVPLGVTCVVDKIEENKNRVLINATVIVERESHKRIIVGKGGSMLKSIGIDARSDLEEYFNKTVYLELFVKVIENWKEKDRYLKELGIDDLDNFE